MKIKFIEIQNFRKLKSCRIDCSDKETVFVGANNSGKTSAMDALILFLKEKNKIRTTDITLSNWLSINNIGNVWTTLKEKDSPDLSINGWEPFLPSLDIWIEADNNEIHFISHLIPTLDWKGGLLGVRLRFEPKDIELLYKEFISEYKTAKETIKNSSIKNLKLKLWPVSMGDFLDKKVSNHFTIRSYILDPSKYEEPKDGIANPQKIQQESLPLEGDPFKGLLKIDIINAQRGFSDPNASAGNETPKINGSLSAQLRIYYSKHLNPSELPCADDIVALDAIDQAQTKFDERLKDCFKSAIAELETLGYPGFSDPRITLTSKIDPIEGLNHSSAVQFEVLKDKETETSLCLPEEYNGLGYQNLVSMVFKLMRFRDEWMRVGKAGEKNYDNSEDKIEPLHLVLIEEPEAHLHAQVQQVFTRKAYSVLRNHKNLEKTNRFNTQLLISTHSSHIAHEIDFTSLRYFRKKQATSNKEIPSATVVNLSQTFGKENQTIKFAIRYLKTTHCDLFFADAIIIIEGASERMLIPHFIKKYHSDLNSSYISFLEIGGSHAHKLKPLIEDLGILTLIITDLDSVDPSRKNSSALPERKKGYKTANNTLKNWLPKKDGFDELADMKDEQKVCNKSLVRVAYQYPINVLIKEESIEVIPYTFEDALVFDNIELFKNLTGNGLIKNFEKALKKSDINEARKDIYDVLREKGSKKKAEFALELLFIQDPDSLTTPKYIDEALKWLLDSLKEKSEDFLIQKDTETKEVAK